MEVFMLIKELLKRQKNNHSIAIHYGEKKVSYYEWDSASQYISKEITEILNDSSVNIGSFLPNSINYAIAYFGVQYANKVLVPIGIQAKKTEILSTVEYCEIDLIITDTPHIDILKKTFYFYNYRIFIYNIDNAEIIEVNCKKQFIFKSKYLTFTDSDNDVAIMLHTSGTTSNPKRVMLTHRNLICNIESNIESLKLTENDKTLIALPMYFGYCNTAQFLTHLYLGASMVILDTIFWAKSFFKIIQTEKITNFTGVPSMLLILLEYQHAENYDYSTLKYICFGGGVMPANKLQLLIEKYPTIGFVHTYGQTECSPRVTALQPNYALSKIGSVGTPIPSVEVRIINKSGIECNTYEIGELIVYGSNVMKGYYKNPNYTKVTIRDGWVHTGDLGYKDSDGYIYLTGRIKNIIISGGINIYPEEIEQILLLHINVKEVCVVGEPHDFLGEVPIAKVVLNNKTETTELQKFCMEHLADYKVPFRFDYVAELSKTYNGKIKRNGEKNGY